MSPGGAARNRYGWNPSPVSLEFQMLRDRIPACNFIAEITISNKICGRMITIIYYRNLPKAEVLY